jgi:hypothetical protein
MSSPHAISDRSARSLFGPLPEFEPDPALWVRIQSLNIRRIRRRRVQRAGLFGVFSVSLLAVWFVYGPTASVFEPKPQSVSVWQEHSQELLDQWHSSEQSELDPGLQARLRWLDNDLQAAYDRGAGEVELGSLWAQRSALLQALVRPGDERSRAVTRI